VLAGGCFRGVAGRLSAREGVTGAVSGYAGGQKSTARYETVGGGDTGRAESVKVIYDPRHISYPPR
jgi:peptide-methionine (S)-S-oxide reductase